MRGCQPSTIQDYMNTRVDSEELFFGVRVAAVFALGQFLYWFSLNASHVEISVLVLLFSTIFFIFQERGGRNLLFWGCRDDTLCLGSSKTGDRMQYATNLHQESLFEIINPVSRVYVGSFRDKSHWIED
jgi:hypothetical protein